METAQQSFPLWGGEAVVAVTDSGRLGAARAAADRVIADVDAACSWFRSDSDLARVNQGAGEQVRVGPVLLETLAAALRAARLSGGLVDPLRTAPWEGVEAGDGWVRIPAGTELDLGAIGKAFAADTAAQAAAEATGCGVLVSLCGDLAVCGPPPSRGWSVRVAEDHRDGAYGHDHGQDIALTTEGGLATSSLTVRTVRLPGGGVGTHILDPRSGLPVRGPWRTVSVWAGDCADANTATTAALVRGAGAVRWLERTGLPARLVHVDGWVKTVGDWPQEDVDVKVAG
ncbi:FAD:protein FMN transferase [Actinomadura barringtoniae]|uniref:FAD:protein FMN transferase n=1 Tax=Actinomadura barringtoniae TaxID=1427535 RepID=A0A939PR51_9ACTN|nr:FAD:protein FMN transferase [Actinomadura barringtoniae]MBO2454664.1 FAD:protein FMN transferase [Actinomadura barringtoniae]